MSSAAQDATRPRLGWYGDDFTGATDTLAETARAGLRSLLREADAQVDRGHWLVFGERNAAHDWFCRE
ncbi:hypothetical protein, partial [Achromobacter aegrifaciens]|uniref:hypothetical protein n=1 Tax=Achromobacter aegrifaciens TaxID=1287736 RepID=UPI0028A8234C